MSILNRRKQQDQYKSQGDIFVHLTKNNSIGSLHIQHKGTVYITSAGAQGFRGARRRTTTAFFAVGAALAEKAQTFGIKNVRVFTQGMPRSRQGIFRGLLWGGLRILIIYEKTPRPHNGCRPPTLRRT